MQFGIYGDYSSTTFTMSVFKCIINLEYTVLFDPRTWTFNSFWRTLLIPMTLVHLKDALSIAWLFTRWRVLRKGEQGQRGHELLVVKCLQKNAWPWFIYIFHLFIKIYSKIGDEFWEQGTRTEEARAACRQNKCLAKFWTPSTLTTALHSIVVLL